ncbi:MAG TPA: OmpH family outer membrane protein [Flavobacteriaceae bacterium]|nr:OmpH family outer membrane protein [Flavobacteriaceae bacterium]
MKQFRSLFIASVLGLMSVSFIHAQNSKIAHIASQELIEAMPEYKAAMTELDQLQNTYKASIEDMMKETQSLSEKYQAEAPTKTDEVNQARALELQGSQTKIREFQQNAYKKLQEKEQELMKPIYEKAKNAIQKVAKAKGFDYVLDSTPGTGVLLSDGYNLMPDVKKELGIQ